MANTDKGKSNIKPTTKNTIPKTGTKTQVKSDILKEGHHSSSAPPKPKK